MNRYLTVFAIAATSMLMQGCLGWGDMFADKRMVVGSYFMRTGEGDEPEYYLFRRGHSGSVSGPLSSIGWNRDFILVQDASVQNDWTAYAVNPALHPVPVDPARYRELVSRLRTTIRLRSPAEVWVHAPELGSWISRPFS